MKKQMLYLIALSMMIILFGCASEGHKKDITSTTPVKEEQIHINLPATGENKLNASAFADTVLYIPLETNSKSFIRGITQLQLTDKYIFINGFDRLLLFSIDGKFIRQIGRKGKGPGEYANIFGFAVDHDTVFISSTGKRSLIKYMVTGDFVAELPAPLQLVRFEVMPDNNIVCYDTQKGNLLFFDRKLNVTDTFKVDYNVSDKREFYSYWDSFDTYFQKSGQRLLFTNYMSDTIWEVSKGQKDIGYVTNLGNQLLPTKYQIEYFDGDFERYKKTAAPFQKIKLIETPSYIFLFQKGWIDNNANAAYFHDIDGNTTQKLDSPSIFDDMAGKQELTVDFITNNCIVATISPTRIIEELKKDQKKIGAETPLSVWLHQMEKVRENDNDVLVIMPVRK